MKVHFLKSLSVLAVFIPAISWGAPQPQKFSDQAWRNIAPIYQKIRNHPFNRELEKGTLDKKKFDFYASQDAYYLEDYAKSFEILAAKLDDPKNAKLALKFATDALKEQKDDWHLSEAKLPAPATLLYTNFELSTAALKTPEELAATLLPCFWIYSALGHELTQHAVSPNPFDNWLKDYRNPDFDKATNQMIDLTNRLAEKASPALRQKMLDAFTMASRMELNFWDSAYKLENWQ